MYSSCSARVRTLCSIGSTLGLGAVAEAGTGTAVAGGKAMGGGRTVGGGRSVGGGKTVGGGIDGACARNLSMRASRAGVVIVTPVASVSHISMHWTRA